MNAISGRARQRIKNEVKEEYLKHEYAIYKDLGYSFACYAITAVLTTMARRGKTPEYIRSIYDDMCFTFSQSDCFGKEIDLTTMMHTFERKYGIDWKKLEVKIETENEFLKGMR